MLSEYGVVLIVIFSLLALFISFYQLYLSVKRKRALLVEEKTTVVVSENFSVNDLALICRALSDSMNYHPDVKFSEKWVLLLRCKQLEVRLAESKDNNDKVN